MGYIGEDDRIYLLLDERAAFVIGTYQVERDNLVRRSDRERATYAVSAASSSHRGRAGGQEQCAGLDDGDVNCTSASFHCVPVISMCALRVVSARRDPHHIIRIPSQIVNCIICSDALRNDIAIIRTKQQKTA